MMVERTISFVFVYSSVICGGSKTRGPWSGGRSEVTSGGRRAWRQRRLGAPLGLTCPLPRGNV